MKTNPPNIFQTIGKVVVFFELVVDPLVQDLTQDLEN